MQNTLPVAQLKESHDLHLDPDQPGASFTLAIAPYPRMTSGDRVTLTWQGYFDDGWADDPWQHSFTVTQPGQVLSTGLDSTYVIFIAGGYAELGYRVQYADAQPSEGQRDEDQAPMQRLAITAPAAPLLPAASIDGHTGPALDPEDFPQGLVLRVAAWNGMQPGDQALLYATSSRAGQSRILAQRVGQEQVDAGALLFSLAPDWLTAQLDASLSFTWQYARAGAAGSSHTLPVAVRAAWRPVAPIVVNALPELNDPQPGRGYIEAMLLRSGAKVRIANEVELDAGDQVQVHWQGFGSTGDYLAEQADASDPRQFSIPASAVPANMGKRLNVLYRVSRVGQPQATSRPFDLRVVAVPRTQFSTVQCACVSSGQLSLACVPAAGVQVTLNRWMFMAPGQQVTILAESSRNETVLDAAVVTDAHLQAGKVLATLSRAYLLGLGSGARLTLRVQVSFDEGHSELEFPSLVLTTAA